MFYDLKYGTKFTSIQRPLAGFWRGANLPYFTKRGDILAYFPHEQKRTVLRAYPELGWIPFRETGPSLGLFFPRVHTLIFQIYSTEDIWGREFISNPHPRYNPNHLLSCHRVNNPGQHQLGHRDEQGPEHFPDLLCSTENGTAWSWMTTLKWGFGESAVMNRISFITVFPRCFRIGSVFDFHPFRHSQPGRWRRKFLSYQGVSQGIGNWRS